MSIIRKHATFDLILHDGKAPPWLITRMKKLGKVVIDIIVQEFGPEELLRRLSDPIWFQALSYVLGYDWDSSGVTTVLTGVLKTILNPDHDVLIAGGKGAKSLETPRELDKIAEIFSLSESKKSYLVKVSRIVAKVDNSLVQDQNKLYHHTILVSRRGKWSVIQQGMNEKLRLARRYHWSSFGLKSFVVDPNREIIGNIKLPFVLDLTSIDSIENQKTTLDLIKDGVDQIKRDLVKAKTLSRKMGPLDLYFSNVNMVESTNDKNLSLKVKLLPNRVNWEALKKAYEISPSTYEELIEIRGLGPGTIRALALVAELVYNAPACWRDPLRYTFAHGGKDGIPYPVNVKRMEKVSNFFESILEDIKMGKEEKKRILVKLSKLLSR